MRMLSVLFIKNGDPDGATIERGNVLLKLRELRLVRFLAPLLRIGVAHQGQAYVRAVHCLPLAL